MIYKSRKLKIEQHALHKIRSSGRISRSSCTIANGTHVIIWERRCSVADMVTSAKQLESLGSEFIIFLVRSNSLILTG